MNLDIVRCWDISLKAISVLQPGDALIFPDRRDLWFFTVRNTLFSLLALQEVGSLQPWMAFFFLLLPRLQLDSSPRSLPAFLFHCIPAHHLFFCALRILGLKS